MSVFRNLKENKKRDSWPETTEGGSGAEERSANETVEECIDRVECRHLALFFLFERGDRAE